MIELTGNIEVDRTLKDRAYFRGQPKYEIVSIVAYLSGVPKRIFENEHEPPQMDVYKRLNAQKTARIVRNLCLLRNDFERNYKAISDAVIRDYRSMLSLSEYLTVTAFDELQQDGVALFKSRSLPNDYILSINRFLADRINNVKPLIPEWINWEYIRSLLIMPDGLKESGIKAAADLYYSKKALYPYQVYINWNPVDEGNILYCDQKFVELLYEWNYDQFTDTSKVSDVSEFTKQNIYDFLDEARKVTFVVDCENSDPYNLCTTLQELPEDMFCKISKIILFDDVHTSTAWEILKDHVDIPVEYLLVERLKEDKSLVDMRLAVRTCREFFSEKVDSFVLVSSDSDYWALISEVPEARFLVMVEHEKCGPDIKDALISSGIFYCYIDDFYSGQSKDLKLSALMNEMNRYIDDSVRLNTRQMLDTALRNTRISMSPAEKNAFYDKYIKPMKLLIDADGNVTLELKKG